jgi:hypothetical protein
MYRYITLNLTLDNLKMCITITSAILAADIDSTLENDILLNTIYLL